MLPDAAVGPTNLLRRLQERPFWSWGGRPISPCLGRMGSHPPGVLMPAVPAFGGNLSPTNCLVRSATLIATPMLWIDDEVSRVGDDV